MIIIRKVNFFSKTKEFGQFCKKKKKKRKNWVHGAEWEGRVLPHTRGILSLPELTTKDTLSCFAWICTKDLGWIYKPNTKHHV